MDCDEVQIRMSAWLDRVLPEADRRQLQAHAERCSGCRKVLGAMRQVARQMALLKQAAVNSPPVGLEAALRQMPSWWVALAVARRWSAAASGVAVAAVVGVLALHLSHPISATLEVESVSQRQVLIPGAGLTLGAGTAVTLQLEPASGRLLFQGPGSLVVNQARQKWIGGGQKLDLTLSDGTLWIEFGPKAPSHLFRLNTPQAVVWLAGTRVMVEATAAATQVHIYEGTAQVVSRMTGQQRTLQTAQGIRVEAGKFLKVEPPSGLETWPAAAGPAVAPEKADASGGQGQPSKRPAGYQLWYEVK